MSIFLFVVDYDLHCISSKHPVFECMHCSLWFIFSIVYSFLSMTKGEKVLTIICRNIYIYKTKSQGEITYSGGDSELQIYVVINQKGGECWFMSFDSWHKLQRSYDENTIRKRQKENKCILCTTKETRLLSRD